MTRGLFGGADEKSRSREVSLLQLRALIEEISPLRYAAVDGPASFNIQHLAFKIIFKVSIYDSDFPKSILS